MSRSKSFLLLAVIAMPLMAIIGIPSQAGQNGLITDLITSEDTLLHESFEQADGPIVYNPPAGWAVIDSGVPEWDGTSWSLYTYPNPGYWTGTLCRVIFAPGDGSGISDWLISPVVDCSNENSVTLTYKQSHSNSSSNPDTAFVLGSIDGGLTWPYYIAIYDTTTGALNHPDTASFDLPWAAGTANVRIAYRFKGSYVLTWYVDEPTLEGDVTDTLLFESFDGAWGPFGNNPPAGWTIINEVTPDDPNTNDWSYWTYSTWGTIAARVNHTPDENQNDWLITPAMTFNQTAICSLSFHVNYWDDDYSNETDTGFVLGSIDGGVTWPYTIAMYAGADEGGSDFGAAYRSYDIGPWAQGEDNVKIAFKYVGLAGWWYVIDEVMVRQITVFEDNIAATSIDYPTEFMIVDQTYAPEVTVQNLGSTQQTFDVNLSIKDAGDDEVYNQTVTGITLDFLETYQVVFPSYIPLDAVDYTLTAVSINPGDEQSDDDSSSIVVSAYQHQAAGGPDDYGYVYIDNTAQEGPVFNWIDISQTGTQIEPGEHYFMSEALPLGFAFEFYGSPYDTMWVNSHGAIHLGARDTWLMTNDCPLPDTSSPHVPMILPFWDRLEIRYEDNQGVYYQYFDDPDTDYVVIQWQATPFGGIGNMLEFEAILFESGNYMYQYNVVPENLSNGQGQTATIGIENEFLPAGLSYLCNDDNVANRISSGLAILWRLGETGFAYLPGDANMFNGAWPPAVIGGDVTYLVNYFRGLTSNPACLLGGFFCSGDANGDCLVIGSDVTRMVSYFRGLSPISYCQNYEPAWLTPDDLPVDPPSGWPGCE